MSPRLAIRIAVGILLVSWLPLIAVIMLGTSDNPIGLGLLAMAGTALTALWLVVFAIYRALF